MDRSEAAVSVSVLPLAETSFDREAARANHVFAVLDQETLDAIGASTLLRESADYLIHRVEADGGRGWTGRYLMMQSTYVELFGPNDAEDVAAPGSIGIALGGDRPGLLDGIERRLRAGGHSCVDRMRRRVVAGEEIDWFRTVGPPEDSESVDAGPTVDVWAMEYVASFMECPAVGKPASLGPADAISRRRYNATSYRGGLFRDLAGARFALTGDCFRSRVEPLLAASGFRLTDTGDGARAEGAESGLEFRFGPSAALLELRFSLGRATPMARSESIGRSMLVVGPGSVATWTFAP